MDFALDSRTCAYWRALRAAASGRADRLPTWWSALTQQGARAVECPGMALHALTPLPYWLSAPTATTAETLGAVVQPPVRPAWKANETGDPSD